MHELILCKVAKQAVCDNEPYVWNGLWCLLYQFGIGLDTVNNYRLLNGTVGLFVAGCYGYRAAQGNFPFFAFHKRQADLEN